MYFGRKVFIKSMRRVLTLAAVIVAAAGIIAAISWSEHRQAIETSIAGSKVDATDTAKIAGFPPLFNDKRDDVSKRQDYVDVCGVGRVPLVPNADVFPPHIVAGAQSVLSAAADQLYASDNEYDRAVGMFTQSMYAATRAADEHTKCIRGDQHCATELMAVAKQAGAPIADQLARLAIASSDPRVYALAFYRCRLTNVFESPEGVCAQLSSARWAQLDSDNAVPWLFEAGVAAGRKDDKTLSYALYRASMAQVSNSYSDTVLRLTDSEAMRTMDLATSSIAYTKLTAMYHAVPAPNVLPVVQHCALPSSVDYARRQTCDDLARLFTERSASLNEWSVGVEIGERVGWAPEKVAAIRERIDATRQLSAENRSQGDASSCRFAERVKEEILSLRKYGALATAQRRLEASGRRTGELANKWRDSQLSARASNGANREKAN